MSGPFVTTLGVQVGPTYREMDILVRAIRRRLRLAGCDVPDGAWLGAFYKGKGRAT